MKIKCVCVCVCVCVWERLPVGAVTGCKCVLATGAGSPCFTTFPLSHLFTSVMAVLTGKCFTAFVRETGVKYRRGGANWSVAQTVVCIQPLCLPRVVAKGGC